MNTPETQRAILAAQTVRGAQPSDYPLPFETLSALLAARAEAASADTSGVPSNAQAASYLVYYDEAGKRHEYSYVAFLDNVAACAALYCSLGIERGSRIATAAHNHPDTIVQYWAAWLLGACVVPLNMSEDDDRLAYILTHAGVRLLLCREDYRQRMEGIGASLQQRVESPSTPSFLTLIVSDDTADTANTRDTDQPLSNASSLVSLASLASLADGFHARVRACVPLAYTDPRVRAAQREDEALIVYTSGTTGAPKGVVLTQRAIMADSAAIVRWHGMDARTRAMCVLPVHHVNGTIVTHTAPMLAGATVVLNRKFQTEHFFTRIAAEGVTVVSVVPTLLAFLLEHAKNSAHTPLVEKTSATTTTLTILCGAGPLTCELARQFEAMFGLRITHGYGLSETTCYSCFLPPDFRLFERSEAHEHWMYSYGFPSIGVPIEANEMAIHDEHGRALAAGERGEIVIRGANVMKEYYHNPDANATTFAHGWFRSGDEGFFQQDAAGRAFFFITGRLKELIIRGGVNLAPLEIDEVLAQAPGVQAGICVGFENDFYGEEVGALVILRDRELSTEASAEAAERILRYCREHLPFAKAPKVVVFANELPVTSTGKYQRNRVKHLFAAWKAVQFKK
jgi:acyl-CoA synthetase (AMP-forming)/AMP-acid ligase II